MMTILGKCSRYYNFITKMFLTFSGLLMVCLISGSVDNSCIIWDVNKGSVHQILDAHLHYVQGVAWDPLGHYVASLSSDQTCRIYVNKPQSKLKGSEKMNYICQHALTKSELQKLDDSKPPPPKAHLFHDETLPSFFRRLAWSSDGSFLLVLAGVGLNIALTAYIISIFKMLPNC